MRRVIYRAVCEIVLDDDYTATMTLAELTEEANGSTPVLPLSVILPESRLLSRVVSIRHLIYARTDILARMLLEMGRVFTDFVDSVKAKENDRAKYDMNDPNVR